MELNDYQRESRKTALYPDVGCNAIYPTLGLVGEAGEVADKVKKILRDKKGVFDKDSKEQIKYELGDVLWYISQISSVLGYEWEDVANANLQKLNSRKARGKIVLDHGNPIQPRGSLRRHRTYAGGKRRL